MAGSTLLLQSIDEYLGPSENRFFSHGYQRAWYHVREITVSSARTPEPGARARVDVGYPADWSTKDGIDQRPHLSTVDALVLGVQLAELQLAHEFGLSAPERASARLRKAVLRSGGAPQEVLTGIPLSARLVNSESLPGAPGRVTSGYDCTVGNLRVRCEIEHPAGAQARTGSGYDSLDDVLGPCGQRYYGEGFKARRHDIRDVRVDMPSRTARAAVYFTAGPGAVTQGIDGELQPFVTVVDAFVVSLQLVQVLLYELDSVARAESNTLWMMQTFLEAPAAPVPLSGAALSGAALSGAALSGAALSGAALSAEASLTNTRLLSLRGGTWRNADIEASLAGVGLRCSFAHELPPRAAAAAKQSP